MYTGYVGVREATGKNDGAEVERFLANCGFKKGAHWCGAFVYTCFLEAGIRPKVRQPAYSPSWFTDTSKVVYRKTWQKTDYKSKKGQVLGLWYPDLNRIGHIGFIDSEDKTNYHTVEGNVGNGVNRRVRPKSSIYIISDYINDKDEKTVDWRNSDAHRN